MSDPRQAPDRRALLQQALESLDTMQAKLDAVEYSRTEPIAIVGMGCRFPGGANTPDEYWRLLCDGVDAVGELPEGRRALVPEIENMADHSALQGGFLQGIDQFDPQFFGIAPREATSMDPQQRLVLEVSWEALERAGIAPDRLVGSSTGIFIGITTNDYGQLLSRDSSLLDVYAATGSALNAAPGRVAYLLGFNGPSVAVDTACSSSLVAIHLASQSLRSGECDMALAGGVNIALLPESFVCFTAWGMLASDGRCKAFDAGADGFVRGEGCGVVVLKRLSDAISDGDNILAVVRGSAVNQDGRSAGLTVPSGTAQRAVIEAALRNAKVNPADVQYVEAHGTGTSLGDPIEVQAIGEALGPGRDEERPLYLGSVKTNLGHLESASGIAGLIKTVLMLQNEQIPPHLHLHQRNPGIPWPSFPIEIPTTLSPWPASEGPRLAGVSGFGLSGTNAHVIIEQARDVAQREADSVPNRHLLALSARDELSLRHLAGRYAEHFRAHPDLALGDVAATAMFGRARLPFRLALSASTLSEAAGKLASFAAGEQVPGVSTGQAPVAGQPRPVFLFTGQGSQYAGMGKELYTQQPVFRATLDQCAVLLSDQLDIPLLDLLFAAPDSPAAALLEQTAYTQPALFALEYGLAQLWRSWGITPAAVAGHSLGEYVAAVIAGILRLDDALHLVAIRGQLMGDLPPGGAMAAIFAPVEQVRDALSPHLEQIAIAAVNGPAHTVISGEQAAVEAVTRKLEEQGVKVRALTVSHAFHSPLMEPMLDAFETAAQGIDYQAPGIPLLANVTGAAWPAGSVPDAGYWRQHVRAAVQWEATVEGMLAAGYEVFVEVGPQPVLSGMGQACAGGEIATWLPSLRRGRDDLDVIYTTLGKLYVAGVDIDWRGVFGDQTHQRVELPTYPFQRRRYWTTAKAGRPAVARRRLLGKRIDLATDPQRHVWEGVIDTTSFPFLDDHRIQGAAVFPATAYIEMAMSAAIEVVGSQPFSALNVDYRKPIIFSPGAAFSVQVTLHTIAEDEVSFEIHSRPADVQAGGWTCNVQGTLMHGNAVAPAAVVDLAAVRERCSEHMAGEEFYGRMAAFGNQWGATFQGVAELWRGEGEALSLVRVPHELVSETGEYHFHPAVADACGHVLTATLPLELRDEHGGAFVGGSIDEARIYHRPQGTSFWCHARLRSDADERANVLVGDVQVFDEEGRLISETIGARLWYLDEAERQSIDPAEWLFTVDWEPAASTAQPDESKLAGAWVVLADTHGVGQAMAGEIRRQGGRCILARAGSKFVQESLDSYTLRADSRADIERMLSDSVQSGELRGIAHLWALDNPPADDLAPLEVLQCQDASVVTAVHLIQSVAETALSPAPRLWIVTRAAQPAGDTPVDPAQSPLWGLGRALALEHSELWGGLVDLDPRDEPATSGRRLASEVLNPEEDQVALRGDDRFVVRLTRLSLGVNAHPKAIRPDATYLITGGLGGLGLGLAERLVSRGARHLILVGRTALPPQETWDDLDPESRSARQLAKIRKLEASGARVHTAAVDVADEPAMRQILDEIHAAGTPPIAGVFHAAGTLHHSTLATLDIDELRRELRAKLVGGWALHRIFRTAELEQFVLFSSASAVLSSPRLGAYAAANAFLDGLARHRCSLGLVGLSVNWGLWGEIGMAAQFDKDDVALLALRGMGVISPDQGLDLLERLMSQDIPQVAVLPVDWSRWRQRYPALTGAPLLRNILGGIEEVAGSAVSSLTAEMLESVAIDEQPSMVEAYLSEQLARVLGIPLDEFDRGVTLSTMGIDSLMAVELKNRAESDLGVVLPIVSLLQGPTTRALAEEVLALFRDRANTPPGAATPVEQDEMASLLAQLDDLTDEQIDALLADLGTERVIADD